MNAYSPLKIIHHRGRVDALKEGQRPDLLHVMLVPTNICNQRCVHCAYRAKGYSSNGEFHERDQIPFDKLVEIVDDCEQLGVRAIEITGGGEPTVHPQFSSLCDCIGDAGIDYAVVTNGALLDDAKLQALAGAKWVRFSLDAGTAETYASIRKTHLNTMGRVLGNISTLKEARGARCDPVIGVGFVVTKDNWIELFKAAELAKQAGADNFRISAVFQNEGAGYFTGFYQQVMELCDLVKTLQDERFHVFDLFGERLSDLESKSPTGPRCLIQHLVTYIGADQNVYRCCVYAYNHLGLLGSLQSVRFYDVWRSKELGNRLQNFDARNCARCMFNSKNATIAYACNPDPIHVNFL